MTPISCGAGCSGTGPGVTAVAVSPGEKTATWKSAMTTRKSLQKGGGEKAISLAGKGRLSLEEDMGGGMIAKRNGV